MIRVWGGVGCAGALAALACAAAPPAWAQANPCDPQPYRWAEDCRGLAGQKLTGPQRLRHLPLGDDAWLTLGGEARVRSDSVRNADFGIDGAPGFLQSGRRLMFHGDLRTASGPRAFLQMAIAESAGRPAMRTYDQDELDVTQAFVDLPLRLVGTETTVRLGRQEISLSDNRLVTTRDGVNIRRTFNGVMVETKVAGARLNLFRLKPTENLRGAFDDRPAHGERFQGASLDLPRNGAGLATLFLFDRTRPMARFMDVTGPERRYTAGVRYVRREGPWDFAGQLAYQWGHARGQEIDAWGGAAGAGYALDAPLAARVGGGFAFASGDKRAGDGKLGTFDPLYPNSYGLSDAPFLHQTNYVAAFAEASARVGPVDLGAAVYGVERQSTGDAIYGNGRPLAGTVGGARGTALLLQALARWNIRKGVDLYGSVVQAAAGDGVTEAGGEDGTYTRLQLTFRF